MLLIPVIYEQAPRLILAIMGAVTLIPAAMILRRLLERHSYPILNAIVIMYFVGQLRVLAASLPVLARFIFLGQMLGATVFLVWVLRNWHLPAEAAETHGRVWRTIRAIAKIGLILLPVGVPRKYFRIRQLGEPFGNRLSQERLHRGHALHRHSDHRRIDHYCLQVRPLGSLRVISLHRTMLQRRTCRVLEFLAFLFWLNLLLNFFGLATPLIATTQAALNANLASAPSTLLSGRILAFLITIWASFLVSKFLRFLLEEDVYPSFASRTRHSVRDLYDASLCHPALRLLRRLGCARD